MVSLNLNRAHPIEAFADALDHSVSAATAHFTSGLSPATLVQSLSDWWAHLASSPGRQIELAAQAARKLAQLTDYALRSAALGMPDPPVEPLPQDRRFEDPAWKRPPFSMIEQAFLLQQQWWHEATTGIGGVTKHHEAVVEFATRQMLDAVSPSNFFLTNPVLQKRIVETGGQCLVQGARYLLEDMQHLMRGEPEAGAEAYPVGGKVAVTPGKVVF